MRIARLTARLGHDASSRASPYLSPCLSNGISRYECAYDKRLSLLDDVTRPLDCVWPTYIEPTLCGWIFNPYHPRPAAPMPVWIACKPGFFFHVRVLSRLFRRLFIEELLALHRAGELSFFGNHEGLADTAAFTKWLVPFRKTEWVVYGKPPFGGPETVLTYLSRYTHRVAISNQRLVSTEADTVAFRWKDYRIKRGDRQKVMRLATPEFIRRFLMHVLPERFHRVRHYGLLASATQKANVARIRDLLGQRTPELEAPEQTEPVPYP